MIRTAVIGASFARDAYLPAFAHVEGAEVVALASGRLESARAAAAPWGIGAVYDDWAAMIAETRPDLVCIATPTDLHLPMARAALEAGAHVLCEKPMAMDTAEAREMLAAARKAGRLHMIDHELRFNPNRARIAQIIAAGDLGEILHVNIASVGTGWNKPASRRKGDWWSDASRGGGRLGANGSHQVDLLRWWLGEPVTVTGQALCRFPERVDPKTGEAWTATADDLTHFTLEWQTGAIAQVLISAVAAAGAGNDTRIFGAKGTLTLSNADERLWLERPGADPLEITQEDPNAQLPGLNPGVWNVSVLAALRDLTGAIARGADAHGGASFLDGLRTQQVLDAVRLSGIERRTIALVPEVAE